LEKIDALQEDCINCLIGYLKNMDVEEHRQPIFVDLGCRSNNAKQWNEIRLVGNIFRASIGALSEADYLNEVDIQSFAYNSHFNKK
jgi:hypothetical protein